MTRSPASVGRFGLAQREGDRGWALNLFAWTVESGSSTNQIPGASVRLSDIIEITGRDVVRGTFEEFADL